MPSHSETANHTANSRQHNNENTPQNWQIPDARSPAIQKMQTESSGRKAAARPSSLAEPAASDMDSLKSLVLSAPLGSLGEVFARCRFQPRDRAYTTLIQACGKARMWQKALEVFDQLKRSSAVKPNVFSYSALVFALAGSGRWQESIDVYREMKQAAEQDPDCLPNSITLSGLISACERGNRTDKAVEMFEELTSSGLEADAITYSSMIAACERAGNLDKALHFLDALHATGDVAAPELYARVLDQCARKGRWQAALDLFLSMQMAGAEVGRGAIAALLAAFEAGGQAKLALQLLQACQEVGISPDLELYHIALRICANQPAGQETAWQVWRLLLAQRLTPNATTTSLILQACPPGSVHAAQITADLRKHGLALPPPSS